ncbi:MAG: SxtJ family membrane protein [Verrucomicrobiales bacterium]
MIELKKSFTQGELRWFGPLFGIFAGLLGWIALQKFDAPAVANGIWLSALGVIGTYYLVPAWRRPIFTAWLALVFPLGWLLSHLLLSLVFYCVVFPIGLMLRVFRYDPLRRRLDPTAVSYWLKRDPPAAPKRYFRQY